MTGTMPAGTENKKIKEEKKTARMMRASLCCTLLFLFCVGQRQFANAFNMTFEPVAGLDRTDARRSA